MAVEKKTVFPTVGSAGWFRSDFRVGSQRNYLEDAGGTGHPMRWRNVLVKVNGGSFETRFKKKIAGLYINIKLYKCVFFWGGEVD